MASNIYHFDAATLGLHSTSIPTQAQDNDTNSSKWVLKFDAATEQRCHIFFFSAPNRLVGPDLRIRWRSAATSGNVVWKVYITTYADAAAVSAATASTVSGTTAAQGTTLNENETVISFGTPATRMVAVTIARDAANVSDTMAGDAELLSVAFEYTVDPNIAKGYLWIPAFAMLPDAAGNASIGAPGMNIETTTVEQPRCLLLPDNSGAYGDCRFTLPSNFRGALKVSVCGFQLGTGSSTAVKLHVDMGAVSVGGSIDPALTSQSSFTLTAGSVSQALLDDRRAAIITPSASQEIVLRVQRDSSDTCVNTFYLAGVFLEYDIFTKRPSIIRLDPASGAQPASSATLIRTDGTNSSRYSASFAQGQDLALDFKCLLPSTYVSGGTLRVRWYSAASSGNAYLRADVASPAVAAGSDPAYTTGTPVASPTSGANLVNETTFSISTGLVASDGIRIRLNRIGSNVLDTITGNTIEITDVIFESNT